MQMKDKFVRNYLFTDREFMVLSAYEGLDRLHMLLEEPQRQMSRQELGLLLFGLYQKEFLCWKEENLYELKPEIRAIFQNIRQAKKELQIYYDRASAPLLCFWGDETVVMELSANDRNTLRVHCVSKIDFLEELEDRGILSGKAAERDEGFSGDEFLEHCPRLMEDGAVKRAELQKLFAKREELSACMIVIDRETGKEQGVILAVDCGILDGLIFVEDGRRRLEWYTPDNLKEFLI